MKVRNGFVSNSSSSSFVLLVDKQSALDILDKINSNVKDKVLELGEVFNENTIVFLGWSNDGGHWLENIDDAIQNCFYKFSDLAQKLPRSKCLFDIQEY